jgi:hypothetical protein
VSKRQTAKVHLGQRALKREEQALDRLDGSRADPPFDVSMRDALEAPALPSLVIEDPLKFVPPQRSADETLLEPLYLVSVSRPSSVQSPAATQDHPSVVSRRRPPFGTSAARARTR